MSGAIEAMLTERRGRLDALLSKLDERIESCDHDRRHGRVGVEMARRSVVVGERRLEDIEDERDLAMKLWVAGSQLREAEDIRRVREAILEIVINLIGCEEVGLFEQRALGSSRYRLTSSLGLGSVRRGELVRGRGWIGRRIVEGEPFLARPRPVVGEDVQARDLHACVFMREHGQIVAVLLLFALLPHCDGLGYAERRLLELLADHGGPALWAAKEDHARLRERA